MRYALPHRHRSAIITAAAVTAVVGIVGTIAVTSGGYAAQRVDLGDASVWVANERLQAVGRASTAALELNSIVETGGGATIAQRGATVLVYDADRSSVGIIDAAASTLTDAVPVPPDVSTLALAGDRVVVAARGKLWTSPVDEFADFEESADPDLTFGGGAVISAAPSGLLFAYTPSTGDLAEVAAAHADQVASQWSLEPFPVDHDVQLTSVDGRWAVFDVDDRVLRLEGRQVDLSGVIGPGAAPQLQTPSDDGDEVWIAHRGGIVAVDLAGGTVGVAIDDRDGTPASPVVHSGCVYAAWAGGSAWRSCDGDGSTTELDGAAGDELAFMSNGRSIVLNDRASGRTWAADAGFRRIDDWQRLMRTERDDEEVERNDPDSEPEIEKRRTPPVAEDDRFGARPGRTTVLPVLLNDYDANGDVLAIDGVDGELPDWARIDLISDSQELQLTLDDAAAGTLRFGYAVDDGHGGSGRAAVEIEVREADENSPPEQRRPIRADVAVGGRVSTPVLGDWVDPDGDPMFLSSAEIPEPDTGSSTAEGTVVLVARDGGDDERRVRLVVSDGRDESFGELDVDVHPEGAVPLEAEPFIALATAGREIVVEPLRHVRGGNGRVSLSAVPAKPDVRITPDFDGGTFRFTSDAVGTHYLEYTVTDGSVPATGFVRVDVQAPPDRDTTPITVPHTAFVRVAQPTTVDVLATDIDPTGGLLVLTEAGADGTVPDGVEVEIVDHGLLRVTLAAPLETGSGVFPYRVSNGLAEATGEVTIVEVPEPEAPQAPIAVADTVSVRTGDVVDIPVLENDEQPDGLPFTLAPELVEKPRAGLLFASGDRLRYFAPTEAGDVTATYRIDSEDQFATAAVTISVREADPETNTEPVPAAVTARVIAGETVRIPIPLSGVDPDGDSVQLLGQQSNPERGTVEETGPDWLDYRAGEYSAGTDEFTYGVIDALGARSEGTVRIGIAPRADRPTRPIAADDLVTVRPDRTITVQVLDNDSDPGDARLRIVGVDGSSGAAEARAVDDRIEVDVPPGDGRYGFSYVIENESLGRAQAWLWVEADEEAPLARPVAADTVLGLTDIAGEDAVVVPVLEHVFLADADVDDAGVDLVDGYRRGAQVLPDGSIRIDVEDRRRVVPFVVRHPDDPRVTAYAFIWVPGRDDALPQLRDDAPEVRVVTGQTVELELADFVIAASGRPVHLTDEASVLASHSDGESLVVDRDTLRFRSEPGYAGPASISFIATDGDGPDDPSARTGTIVVPIEVLADDDEPPAFTGAVLDLEPGQTKAIDLRLLTLPSATTTSTPARTYRVLPPEAEGFDVRLDGDRLTITAHSDAPFGASSAVLIGVADESGEGSGGRIELHVVPSTKPLASPIEDRAIAVRGRTTTIDVLANDEVTNPFPDTPLRVVAVELEGVGEGVDVALRDDGSTLAVTAASNAAPVNTTVRYQVEDATGAVSRRAWGTATISVQDRPEPVVAPQVTGFDDGTIDVAFGAAGFNNSPITGYEIALIDPATGDPRSTTMCAATSCTVETPGNGQGNAVEVRIRARNGIGFSDPQTAPGPVWSDVVPAPPGGLAALPLDGRLRIVWNPVSTGSGSPVHSYVVTAAGVATEVSASACTPSECRVDSQALANGSRVPVSVSARNEAYPALAVWTEASTAGTPFGPPAAGSIDVAGDAAAGAITVTWSPFAANGDAVAGYFVQRLVEGENGVPTGAQACQVTSPAPGTVVAPSSGGTVAETVRVGPEASSLRFTGTAAESTRYSFVVWGYNRAGCAHTGVAGTVVRPGPGGVEGVDSGMAWNGSETWDRYIDDVDVSASRVEIVGVDDRGVQIPGTRREFRGTGWLRDLLSERFDFGETGRFQVRGCTVWGSCGPWSDVLPSGESPTLTFALPSRQWDARRSMWSWTAAPDNSGLPVEFSCGLAGDPVGRPAQTPTSCEIPGVKPGDTVWLDVRIAGVSARYEAKSKETP